MSFPSITFFPARNPIKDKPCIAFSCHVYLVSFNLEQFLRLSFLTLTFLKGTSQLFGSLSLNLSLSGVSCLDLDTLLEGRKITGDDVISFSVYLRGSMMWVCPNSSDGSFDLPRGNREPLCEGCPLLAIFNIAAAVPLRLRLRRGQKPWSTDLDPLLLVRPWESYSTLLNLDFLICKKEMTALLPLQGSWVWKGPAKVVKGVLN